MTIRREHPTSLGRRGRSPIRDGWSWTAPVSEREMDASRAPPEVRKPMSFSFILTLKKIHLIYFYSRFLIKWIPPRIRTLEDWSSGSLNLLLLFWSAYIYPSVNSQGNASIHVCRLRRNDGKVQLVVSLRILTGCEGNVYQLCWQLKPLPNFLIMLAEASDNNECYSQLVCCFMQVLGVALDTSKWSSSIKSSMCLNYTQRSKAQTLQQLLASDSVSTLHQKGHIVGLEFALIKFPTSHYPLS